VAYLIGVGWPADRPLRPIVDLNRRPLDDVVRHGTWQPLPSRPGRVTEVTRPGGAEAATPLLAGDGPLVREHFAEPPGADVVDEPPDRNVRRDPRV